MGRGNAPRIKRKSKPRAEMKQEVSDSGESSRYTIPEEKKPLPVIDLQLL